MIHSGDNSIFASEAISSGARICHCRVDSTGTATARERLPVWFLYFPRAASGLQHGTPI
jgi:hypothetical protein